MENNQAKGASKWLTSRRLIDFYPDSLRVCKREYFNFFFILLYHKLRKKAS